MWRSALIDGGIAIGLLAVWYFCSRHWLRRRAEQVHGWLQLSFRRHGKVSGIQWLSPSRFQVQLSLRASAFRDAQLVVQLTPREMPFSWVWYRLRRHQETATFAANLDSPPSFNLDVQNHRWCASTIEPTSAVRDWSAERLGPMVITTRRDWQNDILNMMDALAASRHYDFLKIAYRKRAPHFSATVALQAIEPDALAEVNVFDVLRELAMSSSPSPF